MDDLLFEVRRPVIGCVTTHSMGRARRYALPRTQVRDRFLVLTPDTTLVRVHQQAAAGKGG
ncbi:MULTISPECIES: hypothetical protein [Neorhizobium]|jgi:hypothetical protein|uniref:hypothetical protein n=1 Tax=Neorhizobium TaxID=1525371 RepID=UPI00155E11E8|nr:MULTISPECIES: hypothetical protein [Neorhizobium]